MKTTAITGTVTDGAAVAWAYAEVTCVLQMVEATRQPVALSDGSHVQTQFTYQLDATGTFPGGAFLPDVADIAPNTSLWQVTVAPYASTAPVIMPLYPVSGSTFNLGAQISADLAAALPLGIQIVSGNLKVAYSAAEIIDPYVGDKYINISSNTGWVWRGDTWIQWTGGGGGGGITGLNGDVLAGVAPFTESTCVMVHAFDQSGVTPPAENSTFQIDTQVPGFPSATSASVGLYAENTFGGTGTFGRLEIYYDNDNLETWVLHFANQISAEEENAYIYCSTQMSFINDLPGSGGQSQFKFGNVYGDTGQMLGIYILNQNPNSIIWLRSEGTDPTPALVFGKGTETIQIEGQAVFIESGVSFDSTPVLPPQNTLIDGGVVAGAIRSQAYAGFQWYTNAAESSIDPIANLALATLEYNGSGFSNLWRLGFSNNMEIVCQVSPGVFKTCATFGIDGGGNATFLPPAGTQINTPSYTMGTIAQNTTTQTLEIDIVVAPSVTTVGDTIDLQGYCGTSSSAPQFIAWRKYPLATSFVEQVHMHITVPAGFYFKLVAQGTSSPTVTELTFTYHN